MKECNFKLTLNDNYEVVAPTIEGLLHNLTEYQIDKKLGHGKTRYTKQEVDWQMPLYQTDLNYFNSEGDRVAEIFEGGQIWSINSDGDLVFNPIAEDGTHVTTIAKTSGHWMSDNKAGWSTQQLLYAEEYANFVTEFGTKFHKFMELRIKHGEGYWSNQETINAFNELKTWLQQQALKAAQWDTQVVARAKGVQEYLKNITDDSLNESIQTCVNQLIAHMCPTTTTKILAEIPVKYKTQRGETIVGRIDALTYDDEGNVHIYDYKTSMSTMNENSKASYTFQLNAYKAMLGALGISANKIHIHILPIQYGTHNGKSELTFMVERVDNSKMSLGVSLPIHLAQRVIRNLRNYFTTSTTPLAVEEAARRKSTLNSQIDAIITPTAKRKSAIELQKMHFQSALDNDNPVFMHSAYNEYNTPGVLIRFKKEGDVIIGVDSEGEIKVRGTLEELAELESNAIKERLSERTELISQAIATGSYDEILNLFSKDETQSTAMQMALEPYFAVEWEEIHIPELKERNIITMFNRVSGEYSFIIVSDFASINTSRKTFDDKELIPPNANILYSVLDESTLSQFREMKSIPGISIEEHLTLEAILAISQFKDLLPDNRDKIKIDRIQVVSAQSGAHSAGINLEKYITTLQLLEHIAKKTPDKIKAGTTDLFKSVYSQFRDNFEFADPIESLHKVLVNRLGAYKLNHPEISQDLFGSFELEMDLQRIKEAQDEIKADFPSEWNQPESPIGRIYLGLDQLAAAIKSGKVRTQIASTTRWGLTGAELLGAGLDLIRYGESRRYSFNGMLVAGMAQGLDNSVSYANPDESIRLFQQLFSSASQQINIETIDVAVEVNNATKIFLEEAGKTAFNRNVLGNTDSAYEDLYEHAENGEISGQMILKNPYENSGLVPYQAKYLETILWSFNRLRMRNLPDSVRKLTYDQLKENSQAFEEYKTLLLNNDKYRYVPLIKTDGASNLITNFQILFNPNESVDDEKGRVGRFMQNLTDRWRQNVEPLLLTPEQKKYSAKDFNPDEKEMTYHSPYNAQNEHRVEMLRKTDMRNWAKNLNFLAIEYTAAHFKEVYYNQLLSLCGNIIGELQMAEIMSGEKNQFKETKEALINRIKVSIFSTDLIPEEAKGAATVLGGLKQATSYLKIAVRPALFVKEMVLGAIKNSATIWAQNLINDIPITFDHIMKAASIVYTNGLFSDNAGSFEGETFGDFRLVNLLNNLYRINDRDLNVIGDSLAYDSHGFMHIGSRMLYLNTTAPDWFHRMTLLVSKMLADGTWDAHARSDDGKLVYDITKDERYKEFVLYYKAHNGDLSREPHTESYVKAKALFQLKVQQLQKQGFTNLKAGEDGIYSVDEIKVAYSQQEMDSFKEQVGMLFGYYSHEERTNTQKGLAWLMHTQFLTFLPGEIRKYLASGQYESSVGKTVHVIDPITKEKLYYRTTEEGLHEVVRESMLAPDEKTEPVYEFTYVPIEGLLVSTLKTVNEIFTGKWDSELNKDRHNRAKLFLFNFLLSIMLKALWGILAVAGVDARKAAKESALLAQTIDLTSRISQELNFFTSVISPIGNLGITGLDILPQVTSVTMSLLGDSGYTLMDGARTLAPIIKDTHLFDN